MAYSVNNAPPNSAANWRVFAPGDSILKSVSRMAALKEILQILINAIAENNATNTIQLPQFTSSTDDDSGLFSAAGSIPYKILIDPVSGDESLKSVNYLSDNLTWVTPTTGDLTGIDNPYDALIYMLRQVNRLNDVIRAGGLVNSAAGLTTLVDEETTRERQFTINTQTVAIITATGAVESILQEHGVIADMQAGILV
jgi:hypothetical protein